MDGLTLAGRIALVTGGAGGIGSAIVRDLADLGATVAVCDVNVDGARTVAASVREASAYDVDLADPASIDRLAETVLDDFGRVDVVVNNAGWDKVGRFVDSDMGMWDRLIGINLRAPVQLTYRLLPGMLERRWGRVLFVASDAARVGSTGEALYAGCKSGQIGFAKRSPESPPERRHQQHRVSRTLRHTTARGGQGGQREARRVAQARSIPIGRLGIPRDVAGMVAFLASERAEFITGQTVSVSGGLTMA